MFRSYLAHLRNPENGRGFSGAGALKLTFPFPIRKFQSRRGKGSERLFLEQGPEETVKFRLYDTIWQMLSFYLLTRNHFNFIVSGKEVR